MNGNYSAEKKMMQAAAIMAAAAAVSVFVAGVPSPSPAPSSAFLTLGGVSALMENSLAGFAPVIFKLLAALCLALLLRKNVLSVVIPLSTVVFLLPAGGEALALPLTGVMALGPLWAAIAAAVILPFFSKLALISILLALSIRFILAGKHISTLAPLAVIFSPPFVGAVLGGDLLLPFYLSACSFPPFGPAPLLSPLFAISFLASMWLFIDGKPDPGKAALAFASFFFGPLAAVPALLPASGSGKKPVVLKILFLGPLLWALAAPQKRAALPEDFKEAISSMKAPAARIACPPRFHNEAAQILKRKDGKGLIPAMTVADLASYYGLLPAMPPFFGHRVPDADLLMVNAYYPEKTSMRPFRKGWKLMRCNSDLVLFASESFLASGQGLKPLNYYNPYSISLLDAEGKKLELKEIETVLAGDPHFFEGLRDAGKLLLDLAEPQKARQYFDQALKLRKSAEIYNNLGVSLANSGEHDEAMEAYLNAMKLSPKDIYPRMNYASAAMAAGKNDEAKMVLEDVVRAYPTFYPAIRFLSQTYGREGNVDRSKDLLAMIPRDQRSPDENELVEGKR